MFRRVSYGKSDTVFKGQVDIQNAAILYIVLERQATGTLFYFAGTLSLDHPRSEPCNIAQHWYSACILLMRKVSYID